MNVSGAKNTPIPVFVAARADGIAVTRTALKNVAKAEATSSDSELERRLRESLIRLPKRPPSLLFCPIRSLPSQNVLDRTRN
jgi:hypothetical protein